MQTNFDDLRFQVETPHGERTFEWDQYPCDLVGIVVDELDDVWLSKGDYTGLIAMSLAPAVSTAIRWSTTVTEVLPDGTTHEEAVPVTVRLINTVTGELLFHDTEHMFRENDHVGMVVGGPPPTTLPDILAAVDERYPQARLYNDQFVAMPDSDKASLFAGILAASEAVKAQLSDIWPEGLDDD